jgi:signal transduction histidine kinase
MEAPNHNSPDPREPAKADHTYRLAPEESPAATYAHVDKVSDVFRQLHALVDASLVSVDKAKTTLSVRTVLTHAHISHAQAHLSNAASELERMSELVYGAMQSQTHSLGSVHLARARPVTLGEAVAHAVDVCKPLSERHHIHVDVQVAASLAPSPAGAIYTVVLNAVQNAIESIARRQSREPAGQGGRIEVELRADAAPREHSYGRDDRAWCTLEVRDDGVGLPKGVEGSRAFDLGFTTKPQGAGVGLSVAKNVIQGMGGTIELLPRVVIRRVEQGSGAENAACPGCTLRVRVPLLTTTRRLSA